MAVLASAVMLLAAAHEQRAEPSGGGCGDFADDCESCLAGGCAWQPNTGGDCYSDCLIMDTSCYTATRGASCPKSDTVCAAQSICEECAVAGCVYQQDTCKPECEFGPLGDFIDRCAQDAATCAELVEPETVDTQPGVICSYFGDDCADCVDNGCAWQPIAGGKCFSDCLVMDTFCYTGSATICPKSDEVCAPLDTCDDCAAAGCIFQQGVCKPESEFGPLGDFIARCASDAAGCSAMLPAQEVSTQPQSAGADDCAAQQGNCSDCLSAGCVYQPDISGGQCSSECVVLDTACVQSASSCPATPSSAAPSSRTVLVHLTRMSIAILTLLFLLRSE
jgi:hypothetical protein